MSARRPRRSFRNTFLLLLYRKRRRVVYWFWVGNGVQVLMWRKGTKTRGLTAAPLFCKALCCLRVEIFLQGCYNRTLKQAINRKFAARYGELLYKIYGKQNRNVIVLLHGGGLSWWNYREVSERLQNDFQIIIPLLDGHAGSDKNFTTIEDNAAEIISFIDMNFGGSVLLIGGLSLGGQILLEMLSQRKNICRFAMVESAAVIPSKLTYLLIKPAFGSCYGLIRKKWFSKLQFCSLRMRSELFNDYYQDTCCITKQNMIAFLQESSMYPMKKSLGECVAETHLFVGERENRRILLSARMLHETLKGSNLHILPALYHGEFSINHADLYVKELCAIVKTH